MRVLDTIYLHCSATRRGANITPADIHRGHLARGFSDTGYHYLVDETPALHAARPLGIVGAHARPFNRRSIGICYFGGLSPDGSALAGPTAGQQRILRATCQTLIHAFPTITRVAGHRDMGAPKDCPCFDVDTWWETGVMTVSRNLA